MNKAQQTAIQAKVFDFALTELVRNHRDSFQPLWTIDSWVKFLIWMALNCGLTGDRESLELFAETLGPTLTRRMRKCFFERFLDDPSISLIADPSETNVFVMPSSSPAKISFEEARKAIEIVGLTDNLVLEQSTWKLNEGIITIAWKSSESNS